MKNEWIVIEIGLPGECVDAVCALLAEVGSCGSLVEERRLDTFVVPDDDLDPTGIYRIKAYFEAPIETESLRSDLELLISPLLPASAISDIGIPVLVKNEDWAENWKQHFPVLRIADRLVIRPSWEPYSPEGDEAVIELDPGMAFGTGTHGTTMLCLEVIAELLSKSSPPQSILDVGTGSGILALGAAVLGCSKILATDIDAEACEVARDNVRKNNLEERIQITDQPLEGLPGTFEIVVANILAEENIRLKQSLLDHLAPGGWLILSGILREKEKLVRENFEVLPLEAFPSRYQEDWTCLVFRHLN